MVTSPSCRILPAGLLSVLLFLLPLECVTQAPATVGETPPRPAAKDPLPPFDKLELLGFLAAAPPDSYAAQVIQARGADFRPDAAFAALFPNSGFQEILRGIKPRAARPTSANRDAAYELLRQARSVKRNRQFAPDEVYQQAVQLAPDSATLRAAYAVNLMVSKNYAAAEVQARQSLKLWPENAAAHGAIALALTAQRHFPEAEAESREALRISPEYHSAMFSLAVSLTYQRKYAEAIPVAQNLIAALPDMPATRKFLGISLLETGKIDEGVSQLDLYVKNAPWDAEGHYYLGVGLRSGGHSEEARARFETALRLQPGNEVYQAAAHPDAVPSPAETETGPKPEDSSISGNLYTNTFFGFTYEFPTGWVTLSSEASRATLEAGAAIISKNDPTEIDVRKAAKKNGHTLLYVAEGGSQPIPMKSVMVVAANIGVAAGLTPESSLKFTAERFKQTGLPMDLGDAPQQQTVGGRSFWKATVAVQTPLGSRYASEFATTEKGYLLVFVVVAPDPMSRSEIEKSLDSIHFMSSQK